MNIIDELYSKKDCIKSFVMSKDQKYACAKNRMKQQYEIMEKTLSDKQMKILNRLIENHYQMSEQENMYFFVKGLKMGLGVEIA